MDAGQDAPAEAINRIFRYDFATDERTERAVIGNPAYAACSVANGSAVVQTSFEPLRQQITSVEVALWRRTSPGGWVPLFRLPYRARSLDGQQPYGHLLIPQGLSPAGQLLCTPVNTARHNQQLLLLRWAH